MNAGLDEKDIGKHNPSRMLYYGRNGPELTHAFGALDVNDMDQLETLIYRFEMLIAYQCIDLPDNITSV